MGQNLNPQILSKQKDLNYGKTHKKIETKLQNLNCDKTKKEKKKKRKKKKKEIVTKFDKPN